MHTVTAFSVHDLRGSSADDDNDEHDEFVLRKKDAIQGVREIET